jgi:hypothetical protein
VSNSLEPLETAPIIPFVNIFVDATPLTEIFFRHARTSQNPATNQDPNALYRLIEL